MTDGSCCGYSNWETFTVGVMLANDEPMNLRTQKAVEDFKATFTGRGPFTKIHAGIAIEAVWSHTEFADRSIWDVGKVNWAEIGDEYLEEEDPGGVR